MTSDADPGYDVELMAAVSDLGAALPSLVDASVRTTLPAAHPREAATATQALADRLAARTRPVERLPELDHVLTFRRVYNPVSGVGSALAPPLDLRARVLQDAGRRTEVTGTIATAADAGTVLVAGGACSSCRAPSG